MLFHALQRVPLSGFAQKAIVFGGSGVHLFFLLSGFGLALSKYSGNIGAFYQRRLVKVWFPYAVALTLSLAVAIVLNVFPDRWAAWCAGVLGYQMFWPEYIESFGGHFWFISAILQFYLVFPALQWLFQKTGNSLRFVGICLALSVVWWVIVFALGRGSIRTWNSFFLQFLWEFGVGMALAYEMKRGTTFEAFAAKYWLPHTWWKWILGGLVCAAIMLVLVLKTGRFGPVFNDIPALMGYGMLCVGVYFFSIQYWPVVSRWLAWLGEVSFSVYLVHIMVLELFLLMLRGSGYSMHIFFIPLFICLACIFGWLFERAIQPFIQQK